MTARVKTFIGTESREMRISRIQSARLRLIGVLTFMSLIEFSTIGMAYYVEIPLWLMIASIICVVLNMPLIWWLCSLWWEQRQHEKELRRQQFNKYSL